MISIASVPARSQSLGQVVERLLPQVDRMNIYLNQYPEIPAYLQHPKVVVARSQDHGDAGDAGKFFWLNCGAEYYLTCDDDILYPHDYATRTIAAIERYGRKAVVGWHGSILGDPFRDYYETRTIFSFYNKCKTDVPVHILGTGTVGLHASTLELTISDFSVPNMADVWLGIKGQQARVPFIVCAHNAGELQPIDQSENDEAIWEACVNSAGNRRDTRARQNEVVRENWPWSIHQATVASRLSRLSLMAGLSR